MPRNNGDPALDDAFRALAHPHRRRLLVALMEHNPQAEVTVPEEIHVDETALEALHEAFYHTHLPLLERLGFVAWDEAAHMVSKGPNFGEVRPLLERLEEHRDGLAEDRI